MICRVSLLCLGLLNASWLFAETTHGANKPQAKAAAPAEKQPPTGKITSYKQLIALFSRQIDQQPWEVSRELMNQIIVLAPADSPELAEALLKAARYAAAHDLSGEAILYYQHWWETGDQSEHAPEILVELGRQCRKVGAITTAVEAFYNAMRISRLAGLRPSEVIKAAQWEVAETSYELRDWERAHKLFEMFVGTYHTEDVLTQSAYYRMGDCSRALGDLHQTMVDYVRALAHNGKHPFALEARMALLDIFLERTNYDSALQIVKDLADTIVALPPNESLYWKRRSGEVLFRHLFQLHSNDVSLSILDALAKMDSTPGWQHQIAEWKGLVYVEKAQWQKALECFSDLSEKDSATTQKNNAPTQLSTLDPQLAAQYAEICKWVIGFEGKENQMRLPEIHSTAAK